MITIQYTMCYDFQRMFFFSWIASAKQLTQLPSSANWMQANDGDLVGIARRLSKKQHVAISIIARSQNPSESYRPIARTFTCSLHRIEMARDFWMQNCTHRQIFSYNEEKKMNKIAQMHVLGLCANAWILKSNWNNVIIPAVLQRAHIRIIMEWQTTIALVLMRTALR